MDTPSPLPGQALSLPLLLHPCSAGVEHLTPTEGGAGSTHGGVIKVTVLQVLQTAKTSSDKHSELRLIHNKIQGFEEWVEALRQARNSTDPSAFRNKGKNNLHPKRLQICNPSSPPPHAVHSATLPGSSPLVLPRSQTSQGRKTESIQCSLLVLCCTHSKALSVQTALAQHTTYGTYRWISPSFLCGAWNQQDGFKTTWLNNFLKQRSQKLVGKKTAVSELETRVAELIKQSKPKKLQDVF